MRTVTTDLTQKLVPLNIISTNNRIQRTSPFFLQPYRMAEAAGAGSTNIPTPHPIQPKPETVTENPPKQNPPPPPPEKPEPGDCCGSGCVRCVWDMYYEELEQYNKLYKQEDPNPKPKS